MRGCGTYSMTARCLECALQNDCPQRRQWCRRRVSVNFCLHLAQCDASCHSTASNASPSSSDTAVCGGGRGEGETRRQEHATANDPTVAKCWTSPLPQVTTANSTTIDVAWRHDSDNWTALGRSGAQRNAGVNLLEITAGQGVVIDQCNVLFRVIHFFSTG